MLKINTNKQEIEYKGLYFPFRAVKSILMNTMPEETFLRHCIHKTFNPTTGRIDRKYAWDSVFEDLQNKGILASVLDKIIDDEYLN